MLTFGQARDWCIDVHGDQKYGDHQYSYHLDATVGVAIRFGVFDDKTLMVCYAHDVLEDTDTTIAQMLAAGFPADVVHSVYCVTDEPAPTRGGRKAKTLPKIASNDRARIAKLCDRIANCEESKRNDPQQLAKYRQEQPLFAQHLRAQNDALEPMWQHLDSLLAVHQSPSELT